MKIWIIVRNDLNMAPGKMASQACHAALGTFLTAQTSRPDIALIYAADPPGTKVCLQGTGQQLARAKLELDAAGVPCFMVVDSGCPNFFDAKPILTAIGFGPSMKHAVQHITRRFQLL